ncbi:MAG TPA: GNAT family N-acetyltransferase [Novosphingobium sp.]|nr:GNAT family N-acetyltransferase [Novosphingobium sp.]HMP56843.1 GNAT family N-acetyltransferase [Novosphingobium sp.]
MFMRSERLFLRPGWPEDWRDLLERIADEAVVRNLATAPWPYGEEHARAWLAQRSEPKLPRLLVTLPGGEGADLVGCVGLHRAEDGVELGYWIGRSHWGLGYATEAVRALLSLARAIGHQRIGAFNFADNPASGRVLAKLGFRPTGKAGPRYSLARGAMAEALGWEIELGDGLDGDGGGPMPLAA